jgi:hypothetical protein
MNRGKRDRGTGAPFVTANAGVTGAELAKRPRGDVPELAERVS